METNNYLRVIQAHKLLIKANIHKLPKYFEHMYDNTDELNDTITTYKKEGIINGKYYSRYKALQNLLTSTTLTLALLKNRHLV